MSDSGNVDTESAATKLAVLVEQMKMANATLAHQAQAMTSMSTIMNELKLTFASVTVELRARSESNKREIDELSRRIDVEHSAALVRDNQHASTLIESKHELVDRINEGLKNEQTEREQSSKQRKEAHDRDITDIKIQVTEIKTGQERFDKKLDNATFWSRIMAGAAALALVAAGAALEVALRHLFP